MKTLCPTFMIGTIQIGTIQDASCVNFGNNFPIDFTSQKKQNQGFGSINGDHNGIHDILSRMSEQDASEVFADLPQNEESEWLERVLHYVQEVDNEQES